MKYFAILLLCSVALSSPLKPVRLDNPRETMASFLQAMNDYKKGLETGDRDLKNRLQDAIRTLDTSGLNSVTRKEDSAKAAIFLKEVIDRVIVIDLSLISDSSTLKYWRLKDTEVRIVRLREGDREGQFVFSKDTVANSDNWYQRIKHLEYKKNSGGGAGYRETPFLKNIPDWAREHYLGIPNWQLLGIFFTLFLGFVMRYLTRLFLRAVEKITRKSRFSFGHILEKNLEGPISLVVASLVWYAGIYILKIDGITLTILKLVVQIVLYASLIWVAYKIADAISGYAKYVAERTENTFDDQLVPLFSKSLRIFVVIFGVLIALQNFGINVMSLLAGLGLGGLAFALAAKDTAANVFGSLMILFDRPFKVGDWVITPGVEGTVTEIGFRSTRIRTFYNSEVSVPNNIMANANIDNMGRREFRRIKALLGLSYDTPAEKVEAFCEGVKNIIKANPHTRKDYMHVCFHSYGDFSLNIMVYCFLTVNDWGDELLQRQNIYLEILRLAESLKVSFAFPTQSIHLESTPEKPFHHPDFEVEQLRATAKDFAENGAMAKSQGHGLFTPNHLD